jgi:hypothetical protein
MKNFRIFSAVLAIVLLPSIALSQGYTVPGSERARPRSLVDHSRTDRLTGRPDQTLDPTYCPSGQVYSGGTCVLISNQAPYDKAWTSYFLGQRKCDDQYCFEITQSGQITASNIHGYPSTTTFQTPSGLMGVGWNAGGIGGCGSGSFRTYTIAPSLTPAQRLAGSAPSDWGIAYSLVYWDAGGCGV